MVEGRPRGLAITGEKFQPYALAIGQTALAWNELHEALGVLFAQALGVGTERRFMAAAIWGAITNDRQKRVVLETAINLIGAEEHSKFPQLANDIIWIIQRSASLEDRRNNVVHSPLAEMTSPLISALTKIPMGEVHPGGVLNERAEKLGKATIYAGKDLLTEIIRYRDYAETLADFSDKILKAWRKPDGTWPERPALPPLKDKG
jgi:hypothetical protein